MARAGTGPARAFFAPAPHRKVCSVAIVIGGSSGGLCGLTPRRRRQASGGATRATLGAQQCTRMPPERRKWALGATTARMQRVQSAPFGEVHTQNALFCEGPHIKCAFPWRRRHRMRFSVRARTQNALFRRVRFSSPAQTWSHLTQRRILRRRSHVKAQSAPATSRKSALCTPDLTEKRTLWPAHTQNALFRDVARPECAFP